MKVSQKLLKVAPTHKQLLMQREIPLTLLLVVEMIWDLRQKVIWDQDLMVLRQKVIWLDQMILDQMI